MFFYPFEKDCCVSVTHQSAGIATFESSIFQWQMNGNNETNKSNLLALCSCNQNQVAGKCRLHALYCTQLHCTLRCYWLVSRFDFTKASENLGNQSRATPSFPSTHTEVHIGNASQNTSKQTQPRNRHFLSTRWKKKKKTYVKTFTYILSSTNKGHILFQIFFTKPSLRKAAYSFHRGKKKHIQ